MSSTIAAIATPLAAGGIGIIRISGDDALNIADKVFRCKSGKNSAMQKGIPHITDEPLMKRAILMRQLQ